MALFRSQRRSRTVDYWPGFVDALSSLLLLIVFLLSIFVLSQSFLSQEMTGKDKMLTQLKEKINELTHTLSLERLRTQESIALLKASLFSAEKEKTALKKSLENINEVKRHINSLTEEVTSERKINQNALGEIKRLNDNISVLLSQISMLENALKASEQKVKDSSVVIKNLGERLNIALAQKVEELNRYRSDFFGRLREILADQDNIRIVGDRFVFQSEVLFKTGSDQMDDKGKIQIKKLAHALIDLEKKIPAEIDWILRVDGHTDDKPIVVPNHHYADNWELSSARATSVIKYMILNGVSPQRLAAAGFGEFHPLDKEKTEKARSRNRRIELKLTER